MPAAFYVPAFGAMLAALTAVVGIGTKVTLTLWNRNVILSDKLVATATETTKALDSAATGIDANTTATEAMLGLVREVHNAIVAVGHLEDHPERSRRASNPAPRRPGG